MAKRIYQALGTPPCVRKPDSIEFILVEGKDAQQYPYWMPQDENTECSTDSRCSLLI